MTHLPTIINDLAMILLVAGVTTILFKKINQPLVLGYIVAGFITGPHFNFFPTITDKANVHAWSEIGVIFLLFALGLEFSFYKLKSVGSTAFIATAVEIGGMLAVGYFAGTLLGWNHMDSLFPGRYAFYVLHHDYYQSLRRFKAQGAALYGNSFRRADY